MINSTSLKLYSRMQPLPVVEQQASIVFHTEDASLKLTLLVPEAIIAVAVVKVHKIEFRDVSIGSLTGQFIVFF